MEVDAQLSGLKAAASQWGQHQKEQEAWAKYNQDWAKYQEELAAWNQQQGYPSDSGQGTVCVG